VACRWQRGVGRDREIEGKRERGKEGKRESEIER